MKCEACEINNIKCGCGYYVEPRPNKVVRRDPFKAIVALQERFKESMDILS